MTGECHGLRKIDPPFELEDGIAHVFCDTPEECEYALPIWTRVAEGCKTFFDTSPAVM